MEIDPDRCYRAYRSRDRRFDGRFFLGVVTTGVYCRPVCPAPSPRRRNVRFFACAAAAEAEGFRPCRRCRPESAPGTPAWVGTSTTVSRALGLIADGALDDAGLDGLSERLGVGERHLRRLFDQHVGASPGAIARTRRVHFARKLIDETVLGMAEIAFHAGFGSVRQFNHAIRRSFGRSPREIRRRAARPAAGNGESLSLRLSYRPPFCWKTFVDFFRPRATPGIESVDGGVYRRTIEFGQSPGVLEVRPIPEERCLRLDVTLADPRELLSIVARVRRIFDLDADPSPILEHLARDRRLAKVLRPRSGVRVPGAWDSFELAVRTILGQQVSVAAATTLAGRLARACGRGFPGAGRGLDRLFPRPEVLADADLRAIGIPGTRAETIRSLARAVCRDRRLLEPGTDLDDAIARLTAICGIGEWTAQYVAMRALREPDAFPAGDLGLRRALGRESSPLSETALTELAEAWRPWRAYAAIALWTHSPDIVARAAA